MSNTTFQTWLDGGSLPPITTAACAAIGAGVNTSDALKLGPTPSATAISALLDALAGLEAAVITLQGA
jgi:hypothetical protein